MALWSRPEPPDPGTGTGEFEGRTAEEALMLARAALGPTAELRCWKTRRGGVAGFFATEVYVAGLTPPDGVQELKGKARRQGKSQGAKASSPKESTTKASSAKGSRAAKGANDAALARLANFSADGAPPPPAPQANGAGARSAPRPSEPMTATSASSLAPQVPNPTRTNVPRPSEERPVTIAREEMTTDAPVRRGSAATGRGAPTGQPARRGGRRLSESEVDRSYEDMLADASATSAYDSRELEITESLASLVDGTTDQLSLQFDPIPGQAFDDVLAEAEAAVSGAPSLQERPGRHSRGALAPERRPVDQPDEGGRYDDEPEVPLTRAERRRRAEEQASGAAAPPVERSAPPARPELDSDVPLTRAERRRLAEASRTLSEHEVGLAPDEAFSAPRSYETTEWSDLAADDVDVRPGSYADEADLAPGIRVPRRRATPPPAPEARPRRSHMPAPAPSPTSGGFPDLAHCLRQLGVPDDYLPYEEHPTVDGLVRSLDRLPQPPALPTRAGSVVVVVGQDVLVDRTIRMLLGEPVFNHGGRESAGRIWQTEDDHTPDDLVGRLHQTGDALHLARRVARRREEGRTSLLTVDSAPGLGVRSITNSLIDSVDPDYVIGAVSASSKRVDVERWVRELDVVDVLALWGTDSTFSPAELFGVLPIAFVEGEQTTSMAWMLSLLGRAMEIRS